MVVAGSRDGHSQLDHFILSKPDEGHFEMKRSTSENNNPSVSLHLDEASPNNNAQSQENYLHTQGTESSSLEPIDHQDGLLDNICGTNDDQDSIKNPADLIPKEAQNSSEEKIKDIRELIMHKIAAINLPEQAEINHRLSSLPLDKLASVINRLQSDNKFYAQNFSKVLSQKYIFTDLNAVITSKGVISGGIVRMKIRDFVRKSREQQLISEQLSIYLTYLVDTFVSPNLFDAIFEQLEGPESFSKIDLVLIERPDFFLKLRKAFMNIVNFRLLRWFNKHMASNIDCLSVEECLQAIVHMMNSNNRDRVNKFISSYGSHMELGQCRSNDFSISQRLEDGAYGQVYSVTHLQNNDKVYVMKVIPWDMVNPIFVENEIQLQSLLNHSNVLPLYCAMYDADGNVSIINEYCPGGDILGRMLQIPPKVYSMDELRLIAIQSLKGLRAIHDKGVVHSDIKPENIFSCADGCVKIADFGLSFLERDLAKIQPFLMGTLQYSAPERILKRQCSRAVDYWALGVTLYSIHAGMFPYTLSDLETKSEDTDAYMQTFSPKFPSDFNVELQAVVKVLLTIDPVERFRRVYEEPEEFQQLPFFAGGCWTDGCGLDIACT